MKISVNFGAITYFNLTLQWLLGITYESSNEKIVDGDWFEGDNGESRITISGGKEEQCIVVITYKLKRFFPIMLGFIIKIDLKVTCIIKDSDRLLLVTQSNFYHVSWKGKYCSICEEI